MSKEEINVWDRVSDWITRYVGSWSFIFSFAIVLFLWVLLNTLAFFQFLAWDTYPFIFLNLLLSFVAAFQAPFIMMSQNRAERKQDEAYRAIFFELKELVEQDLTIEGEVKDLEMEIKVELEKMINQQKQILSNLQQAIVLGQHTRQSLADLIEYYEDEDEREFLD